MYYFDTSALIKPHVNEAGKTRVTELLDQYQGDIFTSSITLVEGYHAICRKCRETKTPEKKANKLF